MKHKCASKGGNGVHRNSWAHKTWLCSFEGHAYGTNLLWPYEKEPQSQLTLVIIAYDSTLLPLVPKILLIQYCMDCTTKMHTLKSQIISIYKMSWANHVFEHSHDVLGGTLLARNAIYFLAFSFSQRLDCSKKLESLYNTEWNLKIYSGILGSPLLSDILHGQLCIM